jgi:hypothetical protein
MKGRHVGDRRRLEGENKETRKRGLRKKSRAMRKKKGESLFLENGCFWPMKRVQKK